MACTYLLDEAGIRILTARYFSSARWAAISTLCKVLKIGRT
jgi:hypothetical protein